MTRRRGRRRKKLLDDLKDRTGYCELKEEALDRTMWRNRFGRGFGPVVWQITDDNDDDEVHSSNMLSPGIRCTGSCHSCYMSGPAMPPLPYIVRCSISGVLSAEIYWQEGHLFSCCHLVVVRANYQSFHYCLLPLAPYRPEIQTNSPDLQHPAKKDNTLTHGQMHALTPGKYILLNSGGLTLWRRNYFFFYFSTPCI